MRFLGALVDAALAMAAVVLIYCLIWALAEAIKSLGSTARAMAAAVICSWLMLAIMLYVTGWSGELE